MKKYILLALIIITIGALSVVLDARPAQAAGVCRDPAGVPTTHTQTQCQGKYFSGYRWDPTGTYTPGVCLDVANKPTSLTKTECERQFALGYKWDPNGTPVTCTFPKILQNGECVTPGNPLGTCKREYTSYGTPKVELWRTTKANCTGNRTWKESTLAEYNAEVAAQTGDDDPPPSTPPTPEAPIPPYQLLSPLPCEEGSSPGCVGGVLTTFDPTGDGGGNIGGYLNIMIRIFIGICAVLAVMMIVVGGLEYMTSDLISSKEHGKERISGAIFGLLLALGSWILLYQINPDLLKADLSSLEAVELEVTLAEDNIQATSTNPACVEADLESITLFGKSGVRVNKRVVPTLRSIEAAWLAKGGNNFYKINTVFGYNCRAVRNKPGFWSAHSFGLALDINQDANPSGKTLVTDMEASKFYQLFTSAGWGWGGSWNSLKDAMHFSSNNK
ncbi:MAG: M15 family metallopeptidase [Minisyncoccia bacterium]